MPRNTKDSQIREDEEQRDDIEAPRVDEIEPEDRAVSKADVDDQDREDLFDEDPEDIDLDDLSAMEGPDA